MDTNGTAQQHTSCECGAARVLVMVPAGTFTWDAAKPQGRSQAHMPDHKPFDRTITASICVRCDGHATDDIVIGKGTH